MVRKGPMPAGVVGTLTIDGTEYVVVERSEYESSMGGTVDAVAYAQTSIASDLRAAREEAGISQAELADRLGKSQPMIARAESGATRVGERYVADVLAACGLPSSWKPKKARKKT